MGYISFFTNFVQIAILMFAWAVVLLSFFILAIQLFVTLIEFKLTTLAGFVLVPFGLFGKTAFVSKHGTVGRKVLKPARSLGAKDQGAPGDRRSYRIKPSLVLVWNERSRPSPICCSA